MSSKQPRTSKTVAGRIEVCESSIYDQVPQDLARAVDAAQYAPYAKIGIRLVNLTEQWPVRFALAGALDRINQIA